MGLLDFGNSPKVVWHGLLERFFFQHPRPTACLVIFHSNASKFYLSFLWSTKCCHLAGSLTTRIDLILDLAAGYFEYWTIYALKLMTLSAKKHHHYFILYHRNEKLSGVVMLVNLNYNEAEWLTSSISPREHNYSSLLCEVQIAMGLAKIWMWICHLNFWISDETFWHQYLQSIVNKGYRESSTDGKNEQEKGGHYF